MGEINKRILPDIDKGGAWSSDIGKLYRKLQDTWGTEESTIPQKYHYQSPIEKQTWAVLELERIKAHICYEIKSLCLLWPEVSQLN